MAQNQNNVLRPPILIRQEGVDPPPNNFAQPPPRPVISPDLQVIISGMIESAINTQCRSLVNSLLNPELDMSNSVDEVIEERFRDELGNLDKVPDIVRSLREFSGNANEFSSWKKSVERILRIYEPTRGTPRYFGILNVIRNKIIGDADIVLESYNTPLNWNAISKCLTLHYADKRDIRTLESQLTSFVQGNNTVQEFYQRVYSHLSLILNKIACLEISNDQISLLTQTYRDKALDTFIGGLNGDLPTLLAIREPVDMPQALHLCVKLQNQNLRSSYANSVARKYSYSKPPALPPKYQPQQHQQQIGRKNFFPHLDYLPQSTRNLYSNRDAVPRLFERNHQHQAQQLAPPRPTAPKPRDLVEPMDVDQSLNTRRVDYLNRPNLGGYQNKRPGSSHWNTQKKQRNFHIDCNTQCHPEHKRNGPTRAYTNRVNHWEIGDSELEDISCTDIHFLG